MIQTFLSKNLTKYYSKKHVTLFFLKLHFVNSPFLKNYKKLDFWIEFTDFENFFQFCLNQITLRIEYIDFWIIFYSFVTKENDYSEYSNKKLVNCMNIFVTFFDQGFVGSISTTYNRKTCWFHRNTCPLALKSIYSHWQ